MIKLLLAASLAAVAIVAISGCSDGGTRFSDPTEPQVVQLGRMSNDVVDGAGRADIRVFDEITPVAVADTPKGTYVEVYILVTNAEGEFRRGADNFVAVTQAGCVVGESASQGLDAKPVGDGIGTSKGGKVRFKVDQQPISAITLSGSDGLTSVI
ncbi:hypothetical protein [Nocardia sp. NPDC058114]|uniref:hypothetical protein n=1 Tax=Nocardia sp. NPDC058114 TaxID=3346346 RepID=UPI0036D7B8D0